MRTNNHLPKLFIGSELGPASRVAATLTRAVTHWDRTAHLGLTLCSLNSLHSCELANYKIQYL